jgi:hypothetical protein
VSFCICLVVHIICISHVVQGRSLRHIVGAYLGYIGISFDASFGTWLRCMLDIWLVVYQ